MRRLGANGYRRPLDVLIFASVVVTVTGFVAFLGLRLLKPNRMEEIGALPDVMGQRCLDQAPKRL